MRVLVIDAPTDARRELCRTVEGLGHETLEAEPAGALALFCEWRPDVVLCRDGAPGSSVRPLLPRLREAETLSYCYVIVLGSFDPAAALALIESGADDVVPDPPSLTLDARLVVAGRVRRRVGMGAGGTAAASSPPAGTQALAPAWPAPVAAVAAPAPPAPRVRTGPIRLIIADDDAIARTAFAGILSSDPDLEVVAVARDADEAIALARTHQPEVVLLDYSMPAGGGLRAATEISGLDPSVHLIGTSGDASPRIRTEMLDTGCRSVVAKAADPSELLQAAHVRDVVPA